MSSIGFDGQRINLQTSFFQTTTITGSPALAAETIVATLTLPVGIRGDQRVFLFGYAAYTVGTSGTAVTFRLRQTNVAGAIVANSGAITAVAAALRGDPIIGIDAPGAVNNQVYVLTMQVTAGAAASTVTQTALVGLVV